MNSNETLMEQIRRLNEQEAVKHELKRQAAINKIKQMRLQKELNGRTTIPQ
jgi:hypothetical protein